MFDLGSVVAHIKADLTGFKEGIDSAKREVSGLGDTFSSIGGGIKDFANQATVFTGVVGAGFAVLAKQAIEAATNFEQNRVAFDTMLGSADKAKTLMKDISDFALKTPFELPQLVSGAQRLLAYNVEGQKIIPTLQMLGNIAAGVGTDKLPQLILAFGQVKAATKLTGAELRQFSEAGVPLLEALVKKANEAGGVLTQVGGASKKTKVDVGEMNDKLAIARKRLDEASKSGKAKESTMMSLRNTVQNYEQSLAKANGTTGGAAKQFVRVKVTAEEMIKKISDGEIKFEDVQAALSGMTGEGGKFFNLMEKQSATFGGVMSNIKDQIGRVMRSVMGIDEGGDIQEGSIFAKLKDGAEALMNFLIAQTPAIVAAVNSAFSAISGIVSNLVTMLQPFADWIMAHQDLVMTFLKGLAIGIGALLVIGTVNALLIALLNPLTLVALGIAALYTAWQTNFLGIQNITQAVFDFITNLVNTYLLPTFDTFVKWLNEVFWPAFNNVFNGFIVPMFNIFVDWFKERWDYISLLVKLAWDVIGGIIKIAWNSISGIITIGLQLLSGNWKGAHETLVNIGKQNWEAIKGIFNGVVDFIRGWGGAVFSGLVKPFEDAWNKVKELADKIKGAMDPNQRHSPSLVDRVQKGVNDLNNAWGNLQFGTQSIASGMSSTSNVGAVPMASGAGIGGAIINIDMSNAYIGNEATAQQLGETIGDQIIKKLQKNVKF